jgi:hypothetical protein
MYTYYTKTDDRYHINTQVFKVRGYDLGLLDSHYIKYQAMCLTDRMKK